MRSDKETDGQDLVLGNYLEIKQ